MERANMTAGAVTIRPAREGDWASMAGRVRPLDLQLVGQTEDDVMNLRYEPVEVVTAETDRVIAMCAVIPVRDRVAEICAVTTADVETHKKDFCVACQGFVDSVFSGLDRLQCTVIEEHPVSHAWVKRMGFQAEGVVRRFYGRKNAILYSRVKED